MKKPYIPLLFTALSVSTTLFANDDYQHMIITSDLILKSNEIDVADKDMPGSPDAGRTLKYAAGANINENGPVSGIAQYRGLYGDRVNISLNGANIATSGPNAMDAPLTYAFAPLLDSLVVTRGIAPVSSGIETLGGSISAQNKVIEFGSHTEFESQGEIRATAVTVNQGQHVSALLGTANQHHKIQLAVTDQHGDDAEFPKGNILPTSFKKQAYGLDYAFQNDSHTLNFIYQNQDVKNSGTPALPMDIQTVEADRLGIQYQYFLDDMTLGLHLFTNDSEHLMNNYSMRNNADMMAYRSTFAEAEGDSFKLFAEIEKQDSLWKLGLQAKNSQHDAVISNPNNAMFEVVNFNDVKRDALSFYVEYHQHLSDDMELSLGLRHSKIDMNTGDVSHSMAMMNDMVRMLRDNFNQADKSVSDNNTDLTLSLNKKINTNLGLEFGFAIKNRVPSYQERYLWAPMPTSGGLADGNTYVGDVNLKSEQAKQFELGLTYVGDNFSFRPRFFHHSIDDYIQGVESNNMSVVMVSTMMMGDETPMQFANVDAKLFGFDADWQYIINDNWLVNGIVSYVKGERKDIDDNLYRIAPPNARINLQHQINAWQINFEGVFYTKQNKVSISNSESQTAGYSLYNLSAKYQKQNWSSHVGVTNLFDKNYHDHTTGINRVMNDDIAVGYRLPGYGRSLFVNLSYQW